MKGTNVLKKSVLAVAFLSLAVPGLGLSSAANARTTTPQNIQRFESSNGEYQVAAALVYCRRVSTRGGNLTVRSSPGGAALGSLRNRTQVRILDGSRNGWVPVASPIKGYVSARYLTRC